MLEKATHKKMADKGEAAVPELFAHNPYVGEGETIAKIFARDPNVDEGESDADEGESDADEGESNANDEQPSKKLKLYDVDSEFKRKEREEFERKQEEDLKKYREEHSAFEAKNKSTNEVKTYQTKAWRYAYGGSDEPTKVDLFRLKESSGKEDTYY